MRLEGSILTLEDKGVTIQTDIPNLRGLGHRDQGALGHLEIDKVKAHLEEKDAESLQEGNDETVARALQATADKRMVQMILAGILRVTKTHLVKAPLVELVIMMAKVKKFKVMVIHNNNNLRLSV